MTTIVTVERSLRRAQLSRPVGAIIDNATRTFLRSHLEKFKPISDSPAAAVARL